MSLRIPALHLIAPRLLPLGLGRGGTVQVPSDPQVPGWYRLGPTPGQRGSAVLLGHVDSQTGPAVFFQLSSLVRGDLVEVTLKDGVTARFRVSSVERFAKARFPSRRVYGFHGSAQLQLVTCGGVFDPRTGHYLSNVVVFSSLASVTKPPVWSVMR